MVEYNPRILVVDIETAPAELYGWGLYNQNFGVEQVKKAPYILCIGLKWVDEKHHEMLTVWDHGQVEMLTRLTERLKEADAIVTKNGVKFDIPWIRTELALRRMPPLPLLTHIDLEKVVRQYFRFFSNKLDWIARYLEVGKKKGNEKGFVLWKEVIEGCPKARKQMEKYCANDLTITEEVYKVVRPHMENHPAIRAVGSEACTKCGSKHTKKDGWRYTKCFRVQQHQCLNPKCNGYFSGKREKVA